MKLLSLIVLIASITLSGENVTITFPSSKNQIISHPVSTINGTFNSATVSRIQILQSYQARISVDVFAREGKERFVVELRTIFPDNVFVSSLNIKTSWAGGSEKKKEYSFALHEEMDIKKFWSSAVLRELLSTVNESKIFYIEIIFQGWKTKDINVTTKQFFLRFGETFSISVPLSLGANTFYLRGFDKKGMMTANDSVKFYRYSEIAGNTTTDGFTKENFHILSNENKCTSCHQTTFQNLSKEASVEKECAPCHTPLSRLPYFHAPSASWECLKCHDSKGEKKFQLNADYSAKICFECHSDKQDDISNKASVHAVVEQCNMCHDVHGADNDMFLVAPVNTICRTCHEEITQKPHPVVNHPIDGRPDPFRKGKEMSCVTCHNPHTSEHPQLLIAPKMSLCQDCHKK